MKNINMTETESVLKGYNQQKLKKASIVDGIVKLFFRQKTMGQMPSTFNSILVVQSHLIGDVVMATTMLITLKRRYPDARIILLANKFALDLLKGARFVDEIMPINFPWSTYDYSLSNLKNFVKTIRLLRKQKIDLAIDAQIDMRNAFLMFLTGAKRRLGYDVTGGRSFLTDCPSFPEHISNLMEARLSLLTHVGISSPEKNTSLPLHPDSLEMANIFLSKHAVASDKLVGIHPGASKREKMWPAENFAEVLNHLRDRGFVPILIEGPQEKELIDRIIRECGQNVACYKGSLQEVTAFISICKLLICLDSAAVHLAAAVGTPAIALYGPQPPFLTKPNSPKIITLWNAELDCRPCSYGACKFDSNKCMSSITPEQVNIQIDRILIS